MVTTTIFMNPYARQNYLDKSRRYLMQRIVKGKGKVVTTDRPEDLDDLVLDFQKDPTDTITLDGGDGSMLYFFTALFKNWPDGQEIPPIAILQGGTWNILAKNVGIKKSKWNRFLKSLTESSMEDIVTEDIGFMKIEDDRGVVTYPFTFGFGFPVKLLEEYYTAKHLKLLKIMGIGTNLVGSIAINTLGKMAYFIKNDYSRQFAEMHKVVVNDDIHTEFLGLMAQTVPSLGLRWSNMFYKATNSSKFHALGVKLELADWLVTLPLMYNGKTNLLVKDYFYDAQTDRLNIKSEKSLKYQANGELEYLGKELAFNELDVTFGAKANIIKDFF